MIESGEIYKLIVENVNDLVAVINQDIIYEFINENVHEKLTGYSSDDLLGKKVLNFVHIEDHKTVLNEFDKSLETGVPFTEIRFKHKEGHFICILYGFQILLCLNLKKKICKLNLLTFVD